MERFQSTWGELYNPWKHCNTIKERLGFLEELERKLHSGDYEIVEVWTSVGYHEPSCPRICEINEIGKHRFVPNPNCKEKFGEH